MDPVVLVSFLGGLALLVGGAELLVRGASRLAAHFGIPPLVIGLTVVSLGTSSPEIAVSVSSALGGSADLAVGNVVGSNIANVLLILGLSAVITPLVVTSRLIRIDVPIMIGASALVLALALNGLLGRGEGVLLLALFGLYALFLVRFAGRASPQVQAEFGQEFGPSPPGPFRYGVAVVTGLVLLLVGSGLLLDSAVDVAIRMGISELVIGLTLIAAGTSMPEIATSVLAAIRQERDIAVGNVVGSNILNLLIVLGLSAAVAPDGIAVPVGALDFDLPFMVVVAVACLPIFVTGSLIARWEGALFLGYYAAYLTYLLLKAAEHDALAPFSAVMAWFVVPLTVITLATLAVRAWRARRERGEPG